jgi:hypothetical protein
MRTAIASSVIGVILFFGVSGVDAAPFEYYEAVVRDRVVTNQVTAVDQTVGEIFDATRTNPVPTQQGATDVSGIEIAMGCDSLVVGVGVTNVRQSNEAAPKLGLATQAFEVSLLGQLDQAFDAMLKAGMQAVVVNAESLFYQGKARIARLAIARRLPTCVWVRELVEDGALVSYGVDQRAIAPESGRLRRQNPKG